MASMEPAEREGSAPDRDETTRFAELLERCEKLSARRLHFDDLHDLARLYRRMTTRLSRLRDHHADPDAVRHLNGLCVRAYAFLYSSGGASRSPSGRPSAPSSPREDLLGVEPSEGTGWRRTLPDTVARCWRAVALAWALLLLGGALGGVLAARDPAALYAMLPIGFGYTPERIDRLWTSVEAREEFLAREDTAVGINAVFGSQLFAHNTRVGILAFATGILAGIPTVMLQLYNGLMLGAFTALFVRDPFASELHTRTAVDFAAWLLPHGIPELTAITLSVAAGLMLGGAAAAPGRRPRRVAVQEAGAPALFLIGCAVPLFFLAALVESFVRESTLGTGFRLGLAGFFALALVAGMWSLRRLAVRLTPRVDTGWLGELGASPPPGGVPQPPA